MKEQIEQILAELYHALFVHALIDICVLGGVHPIYVKGTRLLHEAAVHLIYDRIENCLLVLVVLIKLLLVRMECQLKKQKLLQMEILFVHLKIFQ